MVLMLLQDVLSHVLEQDIQLPAERLHLGHGSRQQSVLQTPGHQSEPKRHRRRQMAGRSSGNATSVLPARIKHDRLQAVLRVAALKLRVPTFAQQMLEAGRSVQVWDGSGDDYAQMEQTKTKM